MLKDEFSVVLLEHLEARLRQHLIRADGQEELTFMLYQTTSGKKRDTLQITDLVLPHDGDRSVHGNVGFHGPYFARAVAEARKKRTGLALIHTHPLGRGWQGLSFDDEVAERRIAAQTLAATGLPLLGLTRAGTDSSFSARRWLRQAAQVYFNQHASNVRIVGKRLQVSLPQRDIRSIAALDRTNSVWGRDARDVFARLRIGIVGVGSVGSLIAELLTRLGVEELLLVDHDRIEIINLDRTINATIADVGKFKVDVAAKAIGAHAPSNINVSTIAKRCDDQEAYTALTDCDVIFACVDRPWARRILNQLSYANGIPISNGGILARTRRGRFVGADWHVQVVGPGRRCMQCWKAFDPADAAIDRDGLLDDPSYVKELDPDSPLIAHANAIPFSMNVASMQVMQMIGMLVGPAFDVGDWNFHVTTGGNDVTSDPGCRPDCPFEAMTNTYGVLPPLRASSQSTADKTA